jgi:PPK2 family polyphosphate:nucleotide phosphotransferase
MPREGKSMIDVERFRVATEVRLIDVDPAGTAGFSGGKEKGRAAQAKLTKKLEALQELLFASGTGRLLIVLQAMDTGGKDGVIRSVFDGVNPQGVKVASLKRPTDLELAHDYLWRIHPRVPAKGEITIFNRSHYEDVLVVRVHNLVPAARWERRFHQINEFEEMLVEEGTTILKFFLHISKDEQKERLQARLDDPSKHWKFSLGDLAERERWDDYQAAYEDVLNKTSSPHAPWYVIPADRKWFRDLVIATVLVETLEKMGLEYPTNPDDLSGVVIS